MARSEKKREIISVQTLLIAVCFLLPTALPLLFSWLDMLLGVPVFILLQLAEDKQVVFVSLRNGLLIATAGVLLLGEPVPFVFSLAMLPLGGSMHRSAGSGRSPVAAGGMGFAVLGVTWLAFWLVQGLLTESNPYASLLALLDSAFARLAEEARTNADFAIDVGHNLDMVIAEIRSVLLPKILPGLLAGSVVLTVWLNMVIGSGLLRRLRPDKAVWPEYQCWRLPDMLIWLLIVAVILLLVGNGHLEQVGYSLAVVAGLLYFFQGVATFAHLLHRWHVPAFWRAVLYFFVAVQVYGMLLLTVIGVADTWADFRRLAQDGKPAGRS